MDSIEFSYITVNGVTLHTATAGLKEGPLAILLHGFPEFWYGWRKQIEPLVNEGYRVVIPDQRGYNLSDKPEGVESYQLNVLRDDIVGIIRYFNREKSVIIGHDWGGIVAWHLAATKPEYVEKLLILNSPHTGIMKKGIMKNPLQIFKSSYILFFQIPELPEKMLSANQYKSLRKSLTDSSDHETFDEKELKHYTKAWSQPEAITSMLNWYRALRFEADSPSTIDVPVKIIWGYRDSFLSKELAEESAKQCTNADIVLVDATHWVHVEQPEIVNKFMLQFLSAP
ncbi:alpha/beta fold hydrolase [Jeotgalibacillus proteolyticus]|uniref:Alpha/beta hydrolase n=1 Tax=Jeotgalibacillus proteolyticus TaxID=2082395 RepID=A0A2S5GB45_9BACL|nr:alpha/beta hydrolase [Jeotgalibacillus proteolyticus]PPA70145.1 alpha/beta hydrolase [Jeotgalibacillus proteolyticus]